MNHRSQATAKASAFTLVEILVVVVILGILIAIALPMLRNAGKSAAETKALASMRTVIQADTMYANENNGQIATLRYQGENLILSPGGKWVGNSFWGKLQPFLFPDITTTDQRKLSEGLETQLKALFGSSDLSKMNGTPLEGAQIYHDTSGLPVPFGFNKYLMPWNREVVQTVVHSLPATILFTYGFGAFDEADGESYVPMAQAGQKPQNNIYYLPSKRAMAGFLDGRVEYLKPPIADRMIKIDGTGE